MQHVDWRETGWLEDLKSYHFRRDKATPDDLNGEKRRIMLGISDFKYVKIFITLILLTLVIQSRINKTNGTKMQMRADDMKDDLANYN